MILLGIDPGLTGAVAAIRDGLATICDLPIVPMGGTGMVKNKLDTWTLPHLLRDLVPADRTVMVIIEDVHTFPGSKNSPQANGSLMRTVGAIEGVLGALRMRTTWISPSAWKQFYGIGSLKASSIAVAQRLYPDAPIKLAKHHNRAEALLLAHYGLRKLA